MLGLLRKLALEPGGPTTDDFLAAKAAGLSRQAILDGLYVGFLFGIYNRCADALKFELQDEFGYANSARFLLSRGYA